MSLYKKIFVPGGAGYVGAVLVPRLLEAGYEVVVYDLFIYGEEPLAEVKDNPKLTCVKGDVRDTALVKQSMEGCDALLHLACISNDPSVELDPDLSLTINFESFGPMIEAAKEQGIKRFIFASSGSVYGVSDDPDVTEEHPLVPVSLYNKYKAKCEPVLLAAKSDDFCPIIVRPATICGYSPRQRLDLTVNILTAHAVHNKKITVFGGTQMRPNIHMGDIVNLYLQLLEEPVEKVSGEIFNAAYQNFSVSETANVVRKVVSEERPDLGEIEIITTPSDDIRSYHISSEKVKRVLGFEPQYTIEDGSRDLIRAFGAGKLPKAMTDTNYYNIRKMKEVELH